METGNGASTSGLKGKLATEPDSLRWPKPSHAGAGHPSVRSDKCNCNHTAPALVDSCFNYFNSGVPYRVMFYNHGDWCDFPVSVVKILIDGFRNEKSSIRFSMGDEPLLLDFLSMVVINLKTRKQRSVAWIDEREKCFFPTVFGYDDDDSNEWDFKKLENGSVRTEAGRAGVSPPEVIKHVVGESERAPPSPQRPLTTRDALRQSVCTLERGSEGFLSIQNQFLSGMGPFARPGNILFIHRYNPKDRLEQKRKETFETLIELVEEERGSANVQYAWFGAKRSETVQVLLHGFGNAGNPTEGVLGAGLYLSPEGRTFASVKLCDVDKKGMQFMMLCRVILGNMEQVHPGSKQYYPSSGDFDSGVDNLSNPKCYVVWPTHMSAYISPEYVVTFKLESNVREYLSGLMDIRYQVATTPALDLSAYSPVVQESGNPLRMPWVPFPVLFETIRPYVSPLVMELLLYHLLELKRKVIDRDELIAKTKFIVGDKLLAFVLARFKHEPSLWFEGPLGKRRRLEESTSNNNNAKDNEKDGFSQPTPGPNVYPTVLCFRLSHVQAWKSWALCNMLGCYLVRSRQVACGDIL